MGNDLYFRHYFVQRFKDEVDPVDSRLSKDEFDPLDSRLSSYCHCFVIKVTESEVVLGERLVINTHIHLINPFALEVRRIIFIRNSILPHR
jgi:hypothetical protein